MDALFERYYRPLVVFAESYLHDLQSAEDLVQEQMVKLWSKQTFAGIVPEALGTFLFTVVKNACINWLEKKRLPVKSLDLLHYRFGRGRTFGRFRGGTDPGSLGKITR